MAELRTDRLLLRQWREDDLTPYAALNADPEVMRHFPATLDRAASDAHARRARAAIAERGWGLWAVEVSDRLRATEPPDTAERPDAPARPGATQRRGAAERPNHARRATRPTGFIGFVGLSVPGFEAHFTPTVEVGWRLVRAAWGHGYATEAARAALAHGFGELGLEEIVSFTTVANARSRAVMERLGMTRDPADDFEHPLLPGSPLAHHVLYRLPRPRPASATPGTPPHSRGPHLPPA